MILVDTSVWIEHLHKGCPELVAILDDGGVLVHPVVIGELACRSIRNRQEVLGLLAALPRAIVAENDEALALIESKKLMDRGLGFIDVHLLASTALTPEARLWTRDRRLSVVASELGVAHSL